MSGEIYDIAKRAVHVFINTGSVPYYVAEQVQRDVLAAGYSKQPKSVNVELAARTLQANTHDSLANSREWEDMTWQEREPWRDRALMVIKAGLEAG